MHKDIGVLMFFISSFMALIIRAELFQPGSRLMHPNFYNQIVTVQGLIMIFAVLIPAFVGFANWQILVILGASDMVFPRLNNWTLYLDQKEIILHPGADKKITYCADDNTNQTMMAQIIPSITPGIAAGHLHKTEYFCFK